MPSLGQIDMPSSSYNPVRVSIDPNDPDYLKKMGMVGALEGAHEMANAQPSTPDYTGGTLTPPEQPTTKDYTKETLASKPGPMGPIAASDQAPQVQYPTEGKPLSALDQINALQPATTRLMHQAEGIKSKPLRVLGEIGAGALTGLEGAASGIFPSIAMQIPGSSANIEARKEGLFERGMAEQKQQIEEEKEREEADYRRVMGAAATQRATTGEENAQTKATDVGQKLTNKLKGQGYQPVMDAQGNVVDVQRMPGYQAKEHLIKGVNPATKQTEYYDSANKEWTGITAPEGAPTWTAVVDPTNPNKSIFVDRRTGKPTGWNAPPSWSQAMAQTRITTMMNPETGVASVYQYNPQTQKYDEYAGVSPTGGLGSASVTAGRALKGAQDTMQLVNDLSPELGPVMGRWNDFLAGKVGATPEGPDGKPDPRYEALRTNLQFINAAAAKFHLNSVRAVEEFNKLADAGKMTPELLNQYILTVGRWAEDVQDQAKGININREIEPGSVRTYGGKTYMFKGGNYKNKADWDEIKEGIK